MPSGKNIDDALIDIHLDSTLQRPYHCVVRMLDSGDSTPPVPLGVYGMIGYKSAESVPNGFGAQLLYRYGDNKIFLHSISPSNSSYISIQGTTISS